MQFDHERERSTAARLEETGQQRFVTVPEIFHVCDINIIRCLCACCHASLLFLVGQRICVSAGYTAKGLLVKAHRSHDSNSGTSRHMQCCVWSMDAVRNVTAPTYALESP